VYVRGGIPQDLRRSRRGPASGKQCRQTAAAVLITAYSQPLQGATASVRSSGVLDRTALVSGVRSVVTAKNDTEAPGKCPPHPTGDADSASICSVAGIRDFHDGPSRQALGPYVPFDVDPPTNDVTKVERVPTVLGVMKGPRPKGAWLRAPSRSASRVCTCIGCTGHALCGRTSTNDSAANPQLTDRVRNATPHLAA